VVRHSSKPAQDFARCQQHSCRLYVKSGHANDRRPQSRRDAGCRVVDAQSCFYHLRILRSVRRQLGHDVTARLVSAFVLSRLDYCNVVLAGLPTSTLAPLQRVLHAAARLVVDLHVRPRDHISQALHELRWLPIDKRIAYKLCLSVHKAPIGQAPTYIADMLTHLSSVQSLNTQRYTQRGRSRDETFEGGSTTAPSL